MKGYKMNSKTLIDLETCNNITILKDNNIKKDELYDAYIIIDEELENGIIQEAEIKEEKAENIEEYEEKIKVQQALFELSLTDVFSKQNVEIVKAYIDKLERNQKWTNMEIKK